MPSQSLQRRGSLLALPTVQLTILNRQDSSGIDSFEQALRAHDLEPLRARAIDVLQVNLGRLCNQTCAHCHVDAGPERREIMSREIIDQCLNVLDTAKIPTLDITGGAPEMNPHFRHLVSEARRIGSRIIDRCNLTILVAAGYEDLPAFLAARQVEITASLPCYLEENCDRQRGDGVFRRSIEALKRLNDLGYGIADSGLTLNLVFNPVGPSLPPRQGTLEEAYRMELRTRYGIEFSRLFTITNIPINRFLDDLLRTGEYERYMRLLVEAFNPATADGVMCRTTLSVDWEGFLYDCDFNQMLGVPVASSVPRHIRDFDLKRLACRSIVTGQHCYACTAGAGSSCQGSLIERNHST